MNATAPRQKSSSFYDVLVISGGVAGCAVARRFTLEAARVRLIEKADDVLAGAIVAAWNDDELDKLDHIEKYL